MKKEKEKSRHKLSNIQNDGSENKSGSPSLDSSAIRNGFKKRHQTSKNITSSVERQVVKPKSMKQLMRQSTQMML
tara:strand:- start:661 stop:885 length:225 start_codon:yes stop_codon:yes gene_type:complete